MPVMEEVDGIPGQIPPLALFPATETRENLPPEEWQACLEAWIFCIEFRLRLLPEHFCHFKFSQAASGFSFLSSYFQSWNLSNDLVSRYRQSRGQEEKMHRHCFLLLRRLLLETNKPYDCSARELFVLLANASAAFGKSERWSDTLQQAWQRQEKQISGAVEEIRSYLIKMIGLNGAKNNEALQQLVRQATSISRSLPRAGRILMTGYDYVDSLATMYKDLSGEPRAARLEDPKTLLTENLFVCLMSLIATTEPSTSLLLDDLYDLKASAEAEAKTNPDQPTLLSSLVCLTSFLRHLEVFLASSSSSRGDSVLHFLSSYRSKMSYLHPLPITTASRWGKGKGKAKANHSTSELHVHKATQVSQIHELFPDTPTAYLLRLLDHFSDDIEAVTSALLEPESLPADLQESRSYADQTSAVTTMPSDLEQHSPAPLTQRRKNIFDDDDFDKLQIFTSQVHLGRKDRNYEAPSDPSDKAKKKAAIMTALAAFDSDEDERDDTYDVADVGGAVDNTVDTDDRPRSTRIKPHEDIDVNEQTLFKAWKSNPEMFARDSKKRMSNSRQQLKSETGMGDEQIEGWALMLSRDDARAQKLENRYIGPASFGGQQKALRMTRWSASASGTATEEDTDAEADGGTESSRGGASGRPFRGGRGFGRGLGKTSGPAGAIGTQNARKRKEQGRGRGGANHNRREGRAKKLGRGFGSLPPG